MQATQLTTRTEAAEGEPMTSAQRRYLFRLMAERGVEAANSHEELKKLFRVNSLLEISKKEASTMIDYLANNQKEGGGNGPSLK